MVGNLSTGSIFPKITLKTVNYGELVLPDDLESKYGMILFYRGGWWGKCTSQLEGYQKYIDILKKVGVSVVAASVDNFSSANEVAKGECYPGSKIAKSYPIGYGVTKELVTVIGSYWKEKESVQDKCYIQPSEFLIESDTGEIIALSYSDGGLGRIDARDVVGFVAGRENMKDNVPHVWPWGVDPPLDEEK